MSFIEPLPYEDEEDDDTDSYEEMETEQECVDNIDEAVAKEVLNILKSKKEKRNLLQIKKRRTAAVRDF